MKLTQDNMDDFDCCKNAICPNCNRPIDIPGDEMFRLYEEGEHDITCPSCNTDFSVSTTVSHTFSTGWINREMIAVEGEVAK